MADTQSAVIVGVFEDQALAEKAYQELRAAGFGQDYLGLADPHASASNKLEQLGKSGVPDGDNEYYQHEFSEGRSLVTVQTGGLESKSVQKAKDILRQYNAYDAQGGRERQGQFGANVRAETSSPYFDLNTNKETI